MPKVQREATLLLTIEELSKALGIPFDQVEQVDWWIKGGEKAGLRLRVRTEDEIEIVPPSKQIGEKSPT